MVPRPRQRYEISSNHHHRKDFTSSSSCADDDGKGDSMAESSSSSSFDNNQHNNMERLSSNSGLTNGRSKPSSRRRRPVKRQQSTDLEDGHDDANNNNNNNNNNDDDDDDTQKKRFKKKRLLLSLPPTVTLPLLVLIDMFAVSLVVPLLFQYYKEAGITSANQREWLSSIFSSSQIVGGLVMGIVTDAKWLQRQTLLYISFVGSALSYGLLVYGNGIPAYLVASRILVGLVKQTMTVTTTMLTHCTLPAQRAQYMGRLTAASTVAWIVGPSTGALLYKYVHVHAPPLVACTLFGVNLVVAALWLPNTQEWQRIQASVQGNGDNDEHSNADTDAENHSNADKDEKSKKKEQQKQSGSSSSFLVSISKNLQAAFSSRALGAVVACRLIYTFVTRATSYSQLGSFYEDMYGLEPHHRGYISSYQSMLSFGVQSFLVQRIVSWSGGERQTVALLTAVLAAMILLESLGYLWLFLVVLSPIIALCMSMINLSLQTLTTQVAPTSGIFSILTALDILQSVVSVSTPFYRTFLFRFLKPSNDDDRDNIISASAMDGDPDPTLWVLTSAVHWTMAAIAMSLLLFSSSEWWKQAKQQQGKPKGK